MRIPVREQHGRLFAARPCVTQAWRRECAKFGHRAAHAEDPAVSGTVLPDWRGPVDDRSCGDGS